MDCADSGFSYLFLTLLFELGWFSCYGERWVEHDAQIDTYMLMLCTHGYEKSTSGHTSIALM